MDNEKFAALYTENEETPQFSTWLDHTNLDGAEPEPVKIDPQVVFEEECALIREEARQQGYQQGMQQAQDELTQKKQIMDEWIALLKNPVQLLDEEIIQDLLKTVYWLCQECIHIELSIHPEKISAIINAVKDDLPQLHGKKTFCVHPDDLQQLQQLLDQDEAAPLVELFEPDATLQRGDFYVTSEFNHIDGRLHTRLKTILEPYIKSE